MCYWDRIIRLSQNDELYSKNALLQTFSLSHQLQGFLKNWQWKVYEFFTLYSKWRAGWRTEVKAPRKKKYIRGNNKSFMTKAYSKTIMQRTRIRSTFLKNPTNLNKVLQNKQRNYWVSLLRKEKKNILCKTKWESYHR